ncbi:MAG: hypothetical protein RI958_2649, partial [Actinomycetota bacterium]
EFQSRPVDGAGVCSVVVVVGM